MRYIMLAVLVTLMVGAFAETAAADRFALLMLGDIKGEHEGGWLDVAGFQHNVPSIPTAAQLLQGIRPEGTESNYTPGDNYQGFVITREVDRCSPAIIQACVRGQRFEEIKLALCNRAEDGITREALFTLKDAHITSMTLMAPGAGERPTGLGLDKPVVAITLAAAVIGNNFEEVKVTYTE